MPTQTPPARDAAVPLGLGPIRRSAAAIPWTDLAIQMSPLSSCEVRRPTAKAPVPTCASQRASLGQRGGVPRPAALKLALLNAIALAGGRRGRMSSSWSGTISRRSPRSWSSACWRVGGRANSGRLGPGGNSGNPVIPAAGAGTAARASALAVRRFGASDPQAHDRRRSIRPATDRRPSCAGKPGRRARPAAPCSRTKPGRGASRVRRVRGSRLPNAWRTARRCSSPIARRRRGLAGDGTLVGELTRSP